MNMTIYSCLPEWEAMLTCIYEAWASGKGHRNIRLELEPLGQYSLLDEYVHVDADADKAQKVIQSVCTKISDFFYQELAYASMAYESDVLDTIYHMMVLGFAYGPDALEMVHYKDAMRLAQIRKRVGNEAHAMLEFLRFHEVRKHVYVAHLEPKSRILPAIAPHFADRMPSEHWMIVDDVHRTAVVHPKDEAFYFRNLTDAEYEQLLETERENDVYTDLWKVFFDSIAIAQRKNPDCQRNLFPIWKRKHAVEFL